MKPHRIQKDALVPSLSYSQVPLLDPKSMAHLQVDAPAQVGQLIKDMRWDWFFDLSCSIARQHRELAATGQQGRPEDATILVNTENTLTPEAAAHAWMISLAQRAAMEIRQLEQADVEQRVSLPSSVGELAGVAFLAATHSPRGTGSRLSLALQKLAVELTQSLAGSGSIEFVHRRPIQLASPVAEGCAVPVAAYRVRFRSCTLEQVRTAITRIVRERSLTEHSGDQLMLSQA
jgi:hypothetical protein